MALKIVISLCLVKAARSDFESKILELNSINRLSRSCPANTFGPSFMKQGARNPFLFGLFVILALLLILITLGVLKGILGFYGVTSIGMFGLTALIDLPRPLDNYQEPELGFVPVEYDIAGWPIHPETKERTVRTITKRTEFCVNVIFFITYPVVMAISFCSMCFQTYDNGTDADKNFRGVHTIVVGDGAAYKKDANNAMDTYNDEDTAEEEDTKYVLDQMHRSQESLKNQNYY